MRIAFGCQARVGKDAACEYLNAKYGGKVLHFSDSLYDILHYAQNTCGFSKSKDPGFLQWVGTWARNIEDNVWIRQLMSKVPDTENCFIGDLRYLNEFLELKKAGFLCVRIIRTNRTIDRDATHSSENSLLNGEWDAIIENNGSIEEFYAALDALIENRFKNNSITLNEQ